MKPPPYGVMAGALIAVSAAYAGAIESKSVFAMVKADRAFIAALVIVLIALLASAYRRAKLEFAGVCVFIIAFPYLSLWTANEWAKDQALVPNDCFTLGDGAVGMMIGGCWMLISYLSQKDIAWGDKSAKGQSDSAS